MGKPRIVFAPVSDLEGCRGQADYKVGVKGLGRVHARAAVGSAPWPFRPLPAMPGNGRPWPAKAGHGQAMTGQCHGGHGGYGRPWPAMASRWPAMPGAKTLNADPKHEPGTKKSWRRFGCAAVTFSSHFSGQNFQPISRSISGQFPANFSGNGRL